MSKKTDAHNTSQDDNSKQGANVSTGSRSDSAGARNKSGNHTGNRK